MSMNIKFIKRNGAIVYQVPTLGGYVETRDFQEAKRIAEQHYLARIPQGFRPSTKRKAGQA